MGKKRRDSTSDDDSYYEEAPRPREGRRDDRREHHRDNRHGDRDDERRKDRRDDGRKDRKDDRRKNRQHDPYDDSRHDRYDDRYDDRRDDRHRRGRPPSIESLESSASYENQKVPTRVNRSCTDIIFLILFFLFLVLWIALAGVVFMTVDVKKMLVETVKDGQGAVCGKGANGGKNLLYIPYFKDCFGMNGLIPEIKCKDQRMWCVQECPTEQINFTLDALGDEGIIEKMVCFASDKREIDDSPQEQRKQKASDALDAGKCAEFIYPTKKILAFCVPDIRKFDKLSKDETPDPETVQFGSPSVDDALKEIKKLAEPETIVQIVLDLWDSGPLILIGFGLSLVLALLWMLLMRFFAGLIVWVTTLLFPVVFGALTGFCAYWSYQLHNKHDDGFNFANITNFPYLMSRFEFRVAVAAVLGILFLLTLLIVVFLRRRIQIAVALIKQASRSISSLPTLVVFPVFPFILQLAGVAVGISVLFLISALRSQLEKEGNSVKATCDNLLSRVTEDKSACDFIIKALNTGYYVHAFNIFSGLWIVMFVGGFSYLVVAHAVARYFWTHKDEGAQCMAVGASVGTVTRYHLGTVAFGSLIVSIVSWIRIVLEWFQGKTKKDKNSCTNAITTCCVCCFYMLEKFLKYINKNAYIMVAMYGKNFCRSAGKAFSLIVSNALRALVVTKLTDFVIFIAKVVTSACAALALYFVIETRALEFLKIPPLFSVFVPTVATGIGSFVVISCFFNVYRSTVDTLFLCFLEDKKINNGSRDRPYRMPSELMMIFNKKNHKRPADRKRQR